MPRFTLNPFKLVRDAFYRKIAERVPPFPERISLGCFSEVVLEDGTTERAHVLRRVGAGHPYYEARKKAYEEEDTFSKFLRHWCD